MPIPADNRYHATILPGLWLNVEWLWQDDLNELAARSEIAGAGQVPAPLSETATKRG